MTAAQVPVTPIAQLLSQESFELTATQHPPAGKIDRVLRQIGIPAGILVFLAIYLPAPPAGLSPVAQSCVASFALALVWWITEPIPTHLTSLVLMILLVVLRGWDTASVLGVFGMDVIWLNILAFVLSAMLVHTQLAKRLSLNLLAVLGRRVGLALGAFAVIQLVLAPLIPATAARAALTLPLMLAVAAIYGSTAAHPNNVGRNMLLLNLTAISVLSSTVMTGSAANLMAVGFIQKLGGHRVYYTDWLVASAPIAILTVVAAWWLGPRVIFPIAPELRVPVVPGGMEAVHQERRTMGKISSREFRAIAIFALVIVLWATDRFQQRWFGIELGAPIAAMIGVVIALMPRIGVIEWKDTNVPWHLMIFSAGAYAGGLALDASGGGAWLVDRVFGGMTPAHVAFGWTYVAVVGVMIYSHLFSTSKTVRTAIMIPAIILLARRLGWEPASLALPAAFTIDWVIGLPVSGKPNVILFATNQYSVRDNLKYGLAVCTVGFVLVIIAGATWFHWLGLTPAFTARH